jgi:hypothetical protein
VIGFTHRQDAEQVLGWLRERLVQYGLTLHPDKTRLVPFRRPNFGEPRNPSRATFDFLGFTLFWRKSRKGGWVPGMKTRKARIQRTLRVLGEKCRRQRHLPLKEQHAALVRSLRGHYSYFGVNGNIRSLSLVGHRLKRLWLYWLRRRSQRGRRLTWERFSKYLDRFPLPRPRIVVQIWATRATP